MLIPISSHSRICVHSAPHCVRPWPLSVIKTLTHVVWYVWVGVIPGISDHWNTAKSYLPPKHVIPFFPIILCTLKTGYNIL